MIYRIVISLCIVAQGIPAPVRAAIEAQPTCAIIVGEGCGAEKSGKAATPGLGCCAVKVSACEQPRTVETKPTGCCDSEEAKPAVGVARSENLTESCCASTSDSEVGCHESSAGDAAKPDAGGMRVCCCCECTAEGPATPVAPPEPAGNRATLLLQWVEVAFIAPVADDAGSGTWASANEPICHLSHNTRQAQIAHWLK